MLKLRLGNIRCDKCNGKGGWYETDSWGKKSFYQCWHCKGTGKQSAIKKHGKPEVR